MLLFSEVVCVGVRVARLLYSIKCQCVFHFWLEKKCHVAGISMKGQSFVVCQRIIHLNPNYRMVTLCIKG